MPHATLQEAGEILEQAAEEATGEAAETLAAQAEQLAALAERDPDHGRLARHQQRLHDVRGEVADAVAARVDEANDRIDAHRETLEGV